MITVGIDASNLRSGGGVTHLIELIGAGNPKKNGISRVIIWGGDCTLAKIEPHPWLILNIIPELSGGLVRRTLWQKFKLPNLARKEGCNILFIPGGLYTGDFKPVVTMSRNLIPFEYKELMRYGTSLLTIKWCLLRIMQSCTFKRVEGVIFLTEYARKTVTNVIGEVRGESRVIPHGINQRFLKEPRSQRSINTYTKETPYKLLYISNIDMYKHQWSLVSAVSELRMRGWNITLDLVGGSYKGAINILNKSIKKHDPKGNWVRYHGPLKFDCLHKIYSQADLGVFASTCENMPNILLEKMSSGIPIACSVFGPMPEILGDGGLFFNPEHQDEITQALEKLISSELLREKLTKKSFERASNYSWAKCADSTFEFLAHIANKYKTYDYKQKSA